MGTNGYNLGAIDGRPSPELDTISQFACNGLSAVMMANEPTNGSPPNCIFHHGFLLAVRLIEPDEPLTVYYGNDPLTIATRLSEGYDIDDSYYSNLTYPGPWAVPTLANANALLLRWLTKCPSGHGSPRPQIQPANCPTPTYQLSFSILLLLIQLFTNCFTLMALNL